MARAPFQVLVIPYRKNSQGSYEFAILKRSDQHYWQFIAGGGEDTETPIEAARRESFEEAAIQSTSAFIALTTICSVPVFGFPAHKNWIHHKYVIPEYNFAVDAADTEIRISKEHTEIQWCVYKEAVERLRWDSNKTALLELKERLINQDFEILR